VPRAPVSIAGRVSVPVGVSETTLSPESVIMYAVVPAEFTAIMRGFVLNRVVPKTLTTGFSGTTPASVSSPVSRLTTSSVVRASSRVTVVMNLRTAFDEQAIPDLNSEAIDFRAAAELFAPYRQLTSQAWSNLRITTEHQGRQVPTIGGLLLFGKDRFARFPDSWIQAGRFAGTNRTRLLDSVEIRSFLPRAAEEALAFTHKHLTRESIVEGIRREDRWSVPLVAIREALMNAIVHADYAQQGAPIRIALYDDRIEIENPGLLPFGLTIEDIMRGVSKLRNRVIGRVFHELHLIEQWGSGIQRMTSACREAGLEVPRLEEIGLHFRVTISSTRVRPPHADDMERRILALFGDGTARSTAAVATHVGLSQRATLTRLKAMTSRGLLAEIGTGPHDPKRQYVSVRE
jgi:ATP-dependent DNA helicase RecG